MSSDYSGARERSFARGQVLLAQGEEAVTLFVVRSGLVKLTTVSPEGREAAPDLLGAGQVFGEQCLAVPREPSSVGATGLVAGRVTVVPAEAIERLLLVDPTRATELLRAVSERLGRTSRLLHDAMLLGVSTRVARRLATLAREHGTPTEEGFRLTAPLTQADLAHLVGSSRETVNKVLAGIAADGLIRATGRGYLLPDLDALERWGDRAAANPGRRRRRNRNPRPAIVV